MPMAAPNRFIYGMQIFTGFTDAIYLYTYIHIHTLANPRFLIEGKILLSPFAQLKLGHFLKSLAIPCYNHKSWKTRALEIHGRFTVSKVFFLSVWFAVTTFLQNINVNLESLEEKVRFHL